MTAATQPEGWSVARCPDSLTCPYHFPYRSDSMHWRKLAEQGVAEHAKKTGHGALSHMFGAFGKGLFG